METKFRLSRASVFRLTEDPSFPDAIRILGSVRWDEAEIDEWIANQPRKRRTKNTSRTRAADVEVIYSYA